MTTQPTGNKPAAPTVTDGKPKRERAPKKPTTLIGTLGKINTMLQAHTADERSKILSFLGENSK